MTYDSKHVEIKNPKEWYNIIAEEYSLYHTHLDNFDRGTFLRYIPRNLEGKTIIDLGAGDGRLRKFFKNIPFQKYIACDIAEKLLKRHPWNKFIEKVVCNLEEKLPFEDNIGDLVLSFFVLEHIENISSLFEEVYRILKPGWQRIIGHFFQRREFQRKKGKDIFKIQFYPHRIQTLEKTAQNNFFAVDIFPVEEKGAAIGHILVLKK